jgi:hypothetical protein
MGELNETTLLWAKTLKSIRESGDEVLLSLLSNITVTFTSDTIVLHAPNRGVFEMIEKNRDKLDPRIEIKIKSQDERDLTITKKLINLFGEKLELF